MAINSNIKQKEEGHKCHSPALFHDKITTCRARRPRDIITWTRECSSPNIVRVIKLRRMRWAGHVARMGEERRCIES